MTPQLLPVDEIPDDVIPLKTQRRMRWSAANDILQEASRAKREMLASERRMFDAHSAAIEAIDVRLDATEGRATRAAESRYEFDRRYGLGADPASQPALGRALADAVGEVREGRSVAYVDFESRALYESGSGGFGVSTQMMQPVEALAAKSVVMQLPGIVRVTATEGDRMRFPRFNAVSVAGTAEGAALNAAATDLDAIDITFQKFSTYETISTELEEDFSADALQTLGNRMLKDLAARVDLGLIEGTGASDTVGIFSQSGVSTTSVAGLPADFDKVAEAIYQLELNDGEPVAWIAHPRTWRIWSQIKTGISSDKTTLLEPDPQSRARTLSGLPVFTTSAISITSGATSAGSTAAVVDTSQIVVVTRRPARLEVSREVGFATDTIGIRATWRGGLGVLDAAGGVSLLTDIRAS